MFGYIDPKEVNELRARLRKDDDHDIKLGLRQLGRLELNELSNMIRDGMRRVLQEKGVLPHGHSGTSPTNPKGIE